MEVASFFSPTWNPIDEGKKNNDSTIPSSLHPTSRRDIMIEDRKMGILIEDRRKEQTLGKTAKRELHICASVSSPMV